MKQVNRTIKKMPHLFEAMAKLTDNRKRRNYSVSELVTGCIVLFLLRQGSRNQFNNTAKEGYFLENYQKVFGSALPHMDTVHAFLKELAPCELEELKATVVSGLIQQKVFSRYKLFDKYHVIAIDGTGINNFDENNTDGNLTFKEYKNGDTKYYTYVLEAKFVTSTGFSISIATEWVENENITTENDKQDCELKAFVRLAAKMKKMFPRLPILIVADGLYPNKTFMETCKANQWEFMAVKKDGNLAAFQKQIETAEKQQLITSSLVNKGKTNIERCFSWTRDKLTYKEHEIYWVSLQEIVTKGAGITIQKKEMKSKKNTTSTLELGGSEKDSLLKESTTTKFVWLSSIEVNCTNVRDLTGAGRNRWKIENEGFNAQKNNGYHLEHLFSRKSIVAYKNYYQCLQIAHLIAQMIEHSRNIKELLSADSKLTIKHFWELAKAILMTVEISISLFKMDKQIQIRLE